MLDGAGARRDRRRGIRLRPLRTKVRGSSSGGARGLGRRAVRILRQSGFLSAEGLRSAPGMSLPRGVTRTGPFRRVEARMDLVYAGAPRDGARRLDRRRAGATGYDLLPMRRRVPGRRAPSAAPRVRPPRGGALRRKEDRPPDAVNAEKRTPASRGLEILDISRPIGERTPGWPGESPFSYRTTSSLTEGAPYESTAFSMSAHLGTHADAPSHVLPDGAAIGAVSLHPFIGPARVLDLPGEGEVGPDGLPARAIGVPRVLFRSRGRAFLSPLAAVRLAERGALPVGPVARSFDPWAPDALPVP